MDFVFKFNCIQDFLFCALKTLKMVISWIALNFYEISNIPKWDPYYNTKTQVLFTDFKNVECSQFYTTHSGPKTYTIIIIVIVNAENLDLYLIFRYRLKHSTGNSENNRFSFFLSFFQNKRAFILNSIKFFC